MLHSIKAKADRKMVPIERSQCGIQGHLGLEGQVTPTSTLQCKKETSLCHMRFHIFLHYLASR